MEIVARASIIFFFLFLLTRGLNRRALSDMAPFELLLLVTIGDMVQQGITQEDFSLTGAVLAGSTFAFWVSVLSYLSWRSRRLGRLLDGVPLVIVVNGQPIDRVLAAEHLPLDEVFEAARQQGIESLDKVKLAVLEPTGRISFIKRDDSR
jgi:uncharacterized membrane protein YcaP (DUF421 family)